MKLTLVSIKFRGRLISRFVPLSSNVLTNEQLHEIFPEMRCMARGQTYSFG